MERLAPARTPPLRAAGRTRAAAAGDDRAAGRVRLRGSQRAGRAAPLLIYRPDAAALLQHADPHSSKSSSPSAPGEARVYICGPTPYDYAHAGHARSAVVFDVLVRHLRARGYEVTYVRNITDVDDKILERAKQNGEEPLELSRAHGGHLPGRTCASSAALDPTHRAAR